MADNNKDVRELLKLKQGLIDEKDSDIQETGYDVRMAQTASEKTKNFLWYHKAMIAGGIVLIILAVIIYLAFFVKKNRISRYTASETTLCPFVQILKTQWHSTPPTLTATANATLP